MEKIDVLGHIVLGLVQLGVALNEFLHLRNGPERHVTTTTRELRIRSLQLTELCMDLREPSSSAT